MVVLCQILHICCITDDGFLMFVPFYVFLSVKMLRFDLNKSFIQQYLALMEMWVFSLYYGTVTLKRFISDITHAYDNFST